MNHRKWSIGTCHRAPLRIEHNDLYADWRSSSLEVERLAKVNGDLCDRIAELEQPIRVPFSDEMIEKMAREASCGIGGWGYDNWDKGIMRDAWRASVRRALAAGGIEPCAVPEYAPEDVALNRSKLADDYSRLQERLSRVSAKSARRAKALKECQRGMARLRKPHDELYRVAYDRFSKTLDDNARLRAELSERRAEQAPMGEEIVRLRQQLYNMNAILKLLTQGDDIRTEEIRGVEDVPLYVPERASDEELAKIGRAAGVWTMEWSELPDGNKKHWIAFSAAVRARVEAPLLAEIERLEEAGQFFGAESHRHLVMLQKAENTCAELLAELEAVKTERDELRGVRERLMLIVEQQAQELQDDPQFRECRKDLGRAQQDLAALRAQLEAVTAEGDDMCHQQTKRCMSWRRCFNLAFRLKNKYRAELAALRQRDAVPVKVRFDVTAALVEEVFSAGDWAEYSWQAVIDYLAAHAVIDVPKGVPSDEELEHVFEQGREEGALVNMEGIRAVRARVEAPLLAEIEELRKENAEIRALEIDEWRAGKRFLAELDAIKEMPEIAELITRRPDESLSTVVMRLRNQRNDLCNKLSSRNERITSLVSELDAVTAERNTLKARVAELEAEARANIEWQEVMALDLKNKKDELDAVTAERDEWKTANKHQGDRLNAYEAELAALHQPVDADAWKTPLEIGQLFGISRIYALENQAVIQCEDSYLYFCPADAARAAQWLASYAAAHGCPASGAIQYKRNPANDGFVDMPVESHPVKVRFDVTEDDAWLVFRDDTAITSPDSMRVTMDYLAAHAVIDVPSGVQSLKSIYAKWKALSFDEQRKHVSQSHYIYNAVLASLPQIAPSTPTDAEVEALARVLEAAYSGWFGIDPRCADTPIGDAYIAEARAAFAHIGRVPAGAELDVTEQAIRNAWLDAEVSGNSWDASKAVLDFCRSRVRPVYECKECAKMKEHFDRVQKQFIDCDKQLNAVRAALEGE